MDTSIFFDFSPDTLSVGAGAASEDGQIRRLFSEIIVVCFSRDRYGSGPCRVSRAGGVACSSRLQTGRPHLEPPCSLWAPQHCRSPSTVAWVLTATARCVLGHTSCVGAQGCSGHSMTMCRVLSLARPRGLPVAHRSPPCLRPQPQCRGLVSAAGHLCPLCPLECSSPPPRPLPP